MAHAVAHAASGLARGGRLHSATRSVTSCRCTASLRRLPTAAAQRSVRLQATDSGVRRRCSRDAAEPGGTVQPCTARVRGGRLRRRDGRP